MSCLQMLFAAKRDGSVPLYETVNGSHIRNLYQHHGFGIWWLKWLSQAQILVSVDRSSRILAYTITPSRSPPRTSMLQVDELRLDEKMKEPIQFLLPNSDETLLLVSTTVSVYIYSLRGRERLAATDIHFRSTPRKWLNHADASLLVLLDGDTVRNFRWTDLGESQSVSDRINKLTLKTIETDNDEPATGAVVRNKRMEQITQHEDLMAEKSALPSEQGSTDSKPPNSAATSSNSSASTTVRSSSIMDSLGDTFNAEVYSSLIMSQQVLAMKSFIGWQGPRLIFQNSEGWVCSFNMNQSTPGTQATSSSSSSSSNRTNTYNPIVATGSGNGAFQQHFIIPPNWQINAHDPVFGILCQGDIAFARGDEIAIFKRGLKL